MSPQLDPRVDGTTGLYLYVPTPNGIVGAATTLKVPAEPPATGTLFLWPGIQPDGKNFYPINNGVLQPVLTWGPSCAPGTQPPAYSTWWVSAQYVNTVGNDPGYTGCQGGPIMSVAVGDALKMTLKLSKAVWTQNVTDVRTGQTVSFAIDMRNQQQNLMYFFIEGYGQYPVGAVDFTNTTIDFAMPFSGSCALAQSEGTDPHDRVSPGVSIDGGKGCRFASITMYSPATPVPAFAGRPPSNRLPISGQASTRSSLP
jgi:hypothetical protein